MELGQVISSQEIQTNKERFTKPSTSLPLAVLFGYLGIRTIIIGHIGHWAITEAQANGLAARFVGLLFVIMAVMLWRDYSKKRKNEGKNNDRKE
jgi:putative Ca2+/H+ antiporter (TMEM165/GDT1 family)